MRCLLFLSVISFLCLAQPLYAGNFHLETSAIGQFLENSQAQQELPVSGFLGLEVDKPEWDNLSLDTNMRLFRDFKQKLDDYDLYQAVLHWQALPALKIDFGRQMISQGFSVEEADALMMTLTPIPYVDLTLYSGVPRTVERGDFSKNDGMLSGLALGLKDIPNTNAQIQASWRKLNIRRNDMRQNDMATVGAHFSYEVPIEIAPLFYGLCEYDVTARVIDLATLGFDIYPHDRIALSVEGNYFNINRDRNQQTILSLFTTDRTWQGRLASTWTIIPDLLDIVESYAFQTMEIQTNVVRRGHVLDSAFQITLDFIGLYIEPGYYFTDSFGGRLHGGRALVHEQFTKELYTEVNVDYSKYTKVTNDNDIAFSTVAWAGYEVIKGLTLSGGFEYNKNNDSNKDYRGSFKVEYRFDHRI